MPQTRCSCDACSLQILERATSRTRRKPRLSASSARTNTIAEPVLVVSGKYQTMNCERGARMGHIGHAPIETNLSAHEEYKQTADRILRDVVSFQWLLDDTEDESPCPSLEASTCSIEGFLNDLNQLKIREASKPCVEPWLMRQLRQVQARWSGPTPGYLDEVNRDSPLLTKQPESSSDIAQFSENSSLSPNALIDALNNAFKPTLKNARWSDTDSDVSELDLEESISGSGSTGSWKTADDCKEVMQRRHSSAASVGTRTIGKNQRTVTRWAHGFGARTASI